MTYPHPQFHFYPRNMDLACVPGTAQLNGLVDGASNNHTSREVYAECGAPLLLRDRRLQPRLTVFIAFLLLEPIRLSHGHPRPND